MRVRIVQSRIHPTKVIFYDVNLYDSDVVETSEPSEDTGPRPYRYEPRRVQRDDGQQQQQSREDETESQTDRLGNTDW